jgi:hypothetical protein
VLASDDGFVVEDEDSDVPPESDLPVSDLLSAAGFVPSFSFADLPSPFPE